MKRYVIAAVLVTIVTGASQSVRAQPQPPQQPLGIGQRPTQPFSGPSVSPYLNLFRGGNPALNYYGVVRPQQQYNSSIQQFQQFQQSVTSQGATTSGVFTQESNQALPSTGQVAGFNTHTQYFMTHLRGGGVGGPGAGGFTSGTLTASVGAAGGGGVTAPTPGRIGGSQRSSTGRR